MGAPFFYLAEMEKRVQDGRSTSVYRKYLLGTFLRVPRTRALFKSVWDVFAATAKSVQNRPRIRLFRMSILT